MKRSIEISAEIVGTRGLLAPVAFWLLRVLELVGSSAPGYELLSGRFILIWDFRLRSQRTDLGLHSLWETVESF